MLGGSSGSTGRGGARCAPAFNGFELPRTTLNLYPTRAEVADLYGDERRELVVSGMGQVAMVEAPGNGTLVVARTWDLHQDAGVVEGDWFGTGAEGLALAVPGSHGVLFRRVFPDGGQADTFVDAGVDLASLVAAHVQGPGAADLLATDVAGAVELISLGATGPSVAQVVPPTSASSVMAIDLDGDGRSDALVGLADGSYLSLVNRCGVLQPPVASGLPSGLFQTLAADLDGDGSEELVAMVPAGGGEPPSLTVFKASPSGSFTAIASSKVGNISYLTVAGYLMLSKLDDGNGQSRVIGLDLAGNLVGIALAGDGGLDLSLSYHFAPPGLPAVSLDLNADGYPDLVVPRVDTLVAYLSRGGGEYRAYRTFAGPDPDAGLWLGISDMAVGDFNGDGRPDLAASNACGDLMVEFENLGGGAFSKHYFSFAQAALLRSVDLYGLGRDQLVALDTVDVGYTRLGVWDFPSAGAVDTEFNVFNYVTDFASSSFLVDGLLVDGGIAAFSHSRGASGPELLEYALDLDGGSSFLQSLPVADEVSVATADLDLDGLPDVVMASAGLWVMRNSGVGLAAPVAIADGGQGPVAIADFNGDGRPDVALGVANGSVAVYLTDSNGVPQFASLVALGTFYQRSRILTGDVNGDGQMDLVASVYGFPAVAFGNGDGTFQAPIVLSDSTSVAIGDFDGDGRLDLVRPSTVGTESGFEILYNTACPP